MRKLMVFGMLVALTASFSSCIYDDEAQCHAKWGQNAVDNLKTCFYNADGKLVFTEIGDDFYYYETADKQAAHELIEKWGRSKFSGDYHTYEFYDNRGSIEVSPGSRSEVFYSVDINVPGIAIMTVWLVHPNFYVISE